jgi:hypothetical protein
MRNLYRVCGIRPDTTTRQRDCRAAVPISKQADRIQALEVDARYSTITLVTGDPPSPAGAPHSTEALVDLTSCTSTRSGGLGTVLKVRTGAVMPYGPLPTSLDAFTRNTYVQTGFKAVTVAVGVRSAEQKDRQEAQSAHSDSTSKHSIR